MTSITRQQVVDKAREYLGTPHIHHGRLKGIGIDCAGLLICIARELGISEKDFNNTNYSPINNGSELLSEVLGKCHEIPNEDGRPADVVIMEVFRHPQHCGLLTDVGIIHSFNSVIEHIIDGPWQGRIRRTFVIDAVID